MEKRLRELIKQAMITKQKNKEDKQAADRYQTLKNILETAQKVAKDKKTDEITDSMIVDAAKKEIKQLNDLLGYCKGNEDKQKEVEFNISVASELLPAMASDEEVKAFVEEKKAAANNIGAMMKLLKEKFGDSLDGKKASAIVREALK